MQDYNLLWLIEEDIDGMISRKTCWNMEKWKLKTVLMDDVTFEHITS